MEYLKVDSNKLVQVSYSDLILQLHAD